MTPLSFRNLTSLYTLFWHSKHHKVGWLETGVWTSKWGAEVKSTLLASSNDTMWASATGIVTQCDHDSPKDPEASSEPDTLSDLDASSETDAPLETTENPDSVQISVCSLLEREVVTSLDENFVGVPRVVLPTRVGVRVPGIT